MEPLNFVQSRSLYKSIQVPLQRNFSLENEEEEMSRIKIFGEKKDNNNLIKTENNINTNFEINKKENQGIIMKENTSNKEESKISYYADNKKNEPTFIKSTDLRLPSKLIDLSYDNPNNK